MSCHQRNPIVSFLVLAGIGCFLLGRSDGYPKLDNTLHCEFEVLYDHVVKPPPAYGIEVDLRLLAAYQVIDLKPFQPNEGLSDPDEAFDAYHESLVQQEQICAQHCWMNWFLCKSAAVSENQCSLYRYNGTAFDSQMDSAVLWDIHCEYGVEFGGDSGDNLGVGDNHSGSHDHDHFVDTPPAEIDNEADLEGSEESDLEGSEEVIESGEEDGSHETGDSHEHDSHGLSTTDSGFKYDYRHRHFHKHTANFGFCGFTDIPGIPIDVIYGSHSGMENRTMSDPPNDDPNTKEYFEWTQNVEHLCARSCYYTENCVTALRIKSTCILFSQTFTSFLPTNSIAVTFMTNIGCPPILSTNEEEHRLAESTMRDQCDFDAERGHMAGKHYGFLLHDLSTVEYERRADECAHLCFKTTKCVSAHLERSVCELMEDEPPELDSLNRSGYGVFIFHIDCFQ